MNKNCQAMNNTSEVVRVFPLFITLECRKVGGLHNNPMKAKIYVIDCFQEKSSTVMASGQSGTTVNEATTAVGELVLHLQVRYPLL